MSIPKWEERPTTVAHLLNPAFCGTVLHRSIQAYQKASIQKAGMPFQLIFLILPMTLHKHIREKLPHTSSKNLVTWIEENQSSKMIIPSIVKNIVPFTKESIMFSMMYSTIMVDEGGNLISIKTPKKYTLDNEINDCFKKAELMGRWLANSGSSQFIFTNLGIKP